MGSFTLFKFQPETDPVGVHLLRHAMSDLVLREPYYGLMSDPGTITWPYQYWLSHSTALDTFPAPRITMPSLCVSYFSAYTIVGDALTLKWISRDQGLPRLPLSAFVCLFCLHLSFWADPLEPRLGVLWEGVWFLEVSYLTLQTW